MKRFTPALFAFIICIFLFCCKTVKEKPEKFRDEQFDNEVSAYLHSADGVMHNAPVFEAGKSSEALQPKIKKNSTDFRQIGKSRKDPSGDGPVLSKKEERKMLKQVLKAKAKADGDDDGKIGLAIGLLILYITLGALIIILLVYLIAAAANNSANSSSNGSGNSGGSGSNSNSGGSGGGGGGSGSNSGCYVATMVYGSYEAPEVMVLRKFRDEKLAHSKAGRAFIKWYYGWSPEFVEKYNHLSWIHKCAKVILDRFVKFLS